MCIDKTLFASFRKIRSINADSVSFVQYALGSGYSQKTDSIFVNTPAAATDTSYSSLIRNLSSDFDWKIINHSLNKVYHLNNYEIEKTKCCSDRGYVVRSYEVNGVRKEGDFYDIE